MLSFFFPLSPQPCVSALTLNVTSHLPDRESWDDQQMACDAPDSKDGMQNIDPSTQGFQGDGVSPALSHLAPGDVGEKLSYPPHCYHIHSSPLMVFYLVFTITLARI
jgi:hypothetical protein